MTAPPPVPDLAGRVVVVTGAGGGIGAAVADRARALGAQVVGLDRAGSNGTGDTDAISLDSIDLDVTDEDAWVSVAARLRERYGRVDGVVTCAGITRRARASDLGAVDLRAVLDVNVVGTHLAVRSLLPLIPRGGSVVMIGSLAGRTGHYPAAYTASKWAVRGLAHATALDLGPRGIRVNVVHPGFIDTEMSRSAPAAFRTASQDATSLGRVGAPNDVADVVAFLLSPSSAFVHGAEIDVDGGAASQAGAKPIADALSSGGPHPSTSTTESRTDPPHGGS